MTDTARTDPFEAARDRDRIGHDVHTGFAAVFLFFVPVSTFMKDPALIILTGYALMRLWATWRTYLVLLRDPVWYMLFAWCGWEVLSLAWSLDPAAGRGDLRAYRFLLIPLAIWPVMERAPWLIGAVLVGVLAQNGLQLAQWLGFPLLRDPYPGGRLAVWQHPIQVGTACAMATCWHTVALLRGRGRMRLFPAGAGLAAIGGLVMSGSRGPWIAALITVPATMIAGAARWRDCRRAVLVTAITGLVAAGVAWPVVGSFVTGRLAQAGADLRAAQDGDYTDVGLRLLYWRTAWDAVRAAPARGMGVGGYHRFARQQPDGDLIPDGAPDAHNAYLHVAAIGGLPGLLLMLGTLAVAVVRAARERIDHVFAGGSLFALLAWLVAGLFDSSHLSGTMFALLIFTIVVTAPRRPAARPALPVA